MMFDWRQYLVTLMRWLLAATFLFSGFVKGVDPWGTAIKFGEYFSAFGLDFLQGLRFPLAMALAALEITLGVALIAKVSERLVALAALCFMGFMTVLTLALAVWNPVNDCGCFGDAVKLTNWQTFWKNVALTAMSFVVYMRVRHCGVQLFSLKGFAALGGIFLLGIMLGVYCYLHLPLIDFLPYKKGVDLRRALTETATNDIRSYVIYRDIASGKEREFDLDDPEWQDTTRWEFVDSRVVTTGSASENSVRDFAIFDAWGDVTARIVDDPGRVWMICAYDIGNMTGRCYERLGAAVDSVLARGERVVVLTASPLPPASDGEHAGITVGGHEVPMYNMDATTMKTMLRARVGVVVLDDGVIVDKRNCRDVSP